MARFLLGCKKVCGQRDLEAVIGDRLTHERPGQDDLVFLLAGKLDLSKINPHAA